MKHRTRSIKSARRVAVVAAAATLLVGACEASEPDAADTEVDTEVSDGGDPASMSEGAAAAPTTDADVAPTPESTAATTPSPAEEPAAVAEGQLTGDAPNVHAVAAAHQTIATSRAEVAGVAAVVQASRVAPPSGEVVGEWIAALTQLEQALDADAIRALGDDPVLEEVAGPIDELDVSVRNVIELLDPATGDPDYLGALAEAQAAVVRWETAVPGVEVAWEDAIARWTAQWELAVDDWELAWEQAVAEWELAWEQAVAEWELAWEQTVVEWELAWEQAAADWRQAWQDAVDEWTAESGAD